MVTITLKPRQNTFKTGAEIPVGHAFKNERNDSNLIFYKFSECITLLGGDYPGSYDNRVAFKQRDYVDLGPATIYIADKATSVKLVAMPTKSASQIPIGHAFGRTDEAFWYKVTFGKVVDKRGDVTSVCDFTGGFVDFGPAELHIT
jgi:hypothetical protein